MFQYFQSCFDWIYVQSYKISVLCNFIALIEETSLQSPFVVPHCDRSSLVRITGFISFLSYYSEIPFLTITYLSADFIKDAAFCISFSSVLSCILMSYNRIVQFKSQFNNNVSETFNVNAGQ